MPFSMSNPEHVKLVERAQRYKDKTEILLNKKSPIIISYNATMETCEIIYDTDLEDIIDIDRDRIGNEMIVEIPEFITKIRGSFVFKDRVEIIGGENVGTTNKLFANSFIKELDLTEFRPKALTDMKSMFMDCIGLREVSFGDTFNTSTVTDMSNMFLGCANLEYLDLSMFETTNVKDMKRMFYECEALDTLVLSKKFNTSNCENMANMFYKCVALNNLDLSSFNTEKVLDIGGMFQDCENIERLDLSTFRSPNVSNAYALVKDMTNLTELNLGNLDLGNLEQGDYRYLLSGLPSLELLTLNNKLYNQLSIFKDSAYRWLFGEMSQVEIEIT